MKHTDNYFNEKLWFLIILLDTVSDPVYSVLKSVLQIFFFYFPMSQVLQNMSTSPEVPKFLDSMFSYRTICQISHSPPQKKIKNKLALKH